MTYTEILKILIEHHKAYKKAVKLTEKEEELLNDYAADLDMNIEGEFEEQENNNAVVLTREEYKKLKHGSGTLEQLYNQYPYRVLVGFNSMVFSKDRESYEKLYNEIEEKARKETAEKFAERLKSRFDKSREYYTIDTGTAWDEGQIGGLINDKIDKICKELSKESAE